MNDRRHARLPNLVLSLVTSMGGALLGLLLVRRFAPAAWLHANNDVAGNYLQTLGTIYAVILAFVVFVVWQQFNDVRGAIEHEANELSDLHRLLQAFLKSVRDPARGCLDAYRQAVVAEEWTAVAQGQASRRAEQALEQVWRALSVIEPRTPREEVFYADALARFNDLSDARTRRLHCSRLRLPRGLWALLLTNGVLVVGSMWLFGLESVVAHALMTAALTGSIAFVLYLIADLDNPFWGSWNVTVEPFVRALDRDRSPEADSPAAGEQRGG